MTTPGWGWRTFVAFVAGGLLAAGGFAVGQRSAEQTAADDEAVTTTAPLNTIPESAEPARTAPTLPLDDAQEPAQAVAELLGPSVVQIEIGVGVGSGVIYGDGLILTNQHVVAGADEVKVTLRDGRVLNGVVVGAEANVDIAVVSVGEGLGLPTAELALGETPSVGQTAIAIGSPFRLQQTVTEGIVSSVNRPIRNGQGYTAMIQTDAPINPGNSGGALADRFGRVIGINTAIQTQNLDNTNSGVGFAVPIDTAKSVADRIVAGEPILGGFLGVEGGPSADGAAGVELSSVSPDSAAEQAGLEPGDLIVSIDEIPVTQFEELAGLVVARTPGDVVALEVVREGERLTIEATLGERP
ncbi:MAG: trypsin-like peptidase domain-containing protein [Actinomycetota bacterium]